jgi:predicted transcriptional regulator of viral defense system
LTHPLAIRRHVQRDSVRSEPEQLWTVEIKRQERTLRVTTPERTLVDGFKELSLVGGLDELVDSMDGFATLNPDLLREVLDTYKNKRLWAAVGWYLKRRLMSLFLEDTVLEDFKANRPNTRVYLVPGQRGGVVDAEWNLVVPDHIQKAAVGGDNGP